MQRRIFALTRRHTKITIQENIPLAPLTTLKVGGAARFFVKAQTENEIIEAVSWTKKNNLPLFILGGGSNLLVSDEGFDGLVMQIALKGIKINGNIVTAQAGEDWDDFVKFCVAENLQGVECLSGIPGFTGGTPVQNVGAYGQEVSETIIKVRVFDRKNVQILELSNADCKFKYRASIFNTTDKNRFIVLAVTFALKKDGAPKLVYKDLREFFGEKKPSLKETREAVLKIRRAKSMVIDETDGNTRSVGSFFKNPIVTNEKYDEMQRDFEGEIPKYTVDENSSKIPAAWLIEQSGFAKGYKSGNAGLSENHTLAIVNRGAATAEDILRLKEKIQRQVKEKFDVELKPEPIFVAFDEN